MKFKLFFKKKTAQAQEHKMQRRQLNEQIVHADERFEIMKENQRLVVSWF